MKTILYRLAMGGIVSASLLLALLGLTGSIQAFYYEIDEWLNPHFYQTPTKGTAKHPADLIETLEAAVPEAMVWYLEMQKGPGRSVMVGVEPRPDMATGIKPTLEKDYYYMDPVSGDIVGSRFWGACCFSAENFINFTYEIHRDLTLPGVWGLYLTGFLACFWFLSSVVFLYRLARKGKATRRVAFSTLSAKAQAAIVVVMIPVAFSSIELNLSEEVFKPVVSLFSGTQPSIYADYAQKSPETFGARTLSYRDAYEIAEALGKKAGETAPVGELFYSIPYNFYGMAYGARDPVGMGNNWVYISAADGTVVGSKRPLDGSAGDVFTSAQLALHSGRGFGLWNQIYICLIGLLLVGVCWRVGRWAYRQAMA
ncbi:MAG: PepSY domain-containing protein [Kordiimonadaceae bacterium]|nr:PepSY domain-containing protein [Kordiimonadaceae bacterium]